MKYTLKKGEVWALYKTWDVTNCADGSEELEIVVECDDITVTYRKQQFVNIFDVGIKI